MKIIFISGLYPKEFVDELQSNSKGLIQYGPNKLQHTFVDGLSLFYENLVVITAPLIGSFPKHYKKIIIPKRLFYINNQIKCYLVSNLNLPFFSLFSKFIFLFFRILRETDPQKTNCLVVYSPHMPYLLASIFSKLIYRKNKICMYINDLPEFMSANTNILYLAAKQVEKKIFNILIKFVDAFIVVTDEVPKKLMIESKPHFRLEGVYKESAPLISKKNVENSPKIKILYSGTLDKRYGIDNLLKAFALIQQEDFELWICGFGDMENDIKRYQSKDTRIKFFGQLTHEEAICLQSEASILVNPRLPIGDYTKFSFPIKTLEYLASLKPCIMYKLPGIPEEYTPHFYTPVDQTEEGLAKKIIEVANMDPIIVEKMAEQSRQFIIRDIGINCKFKALSFFLNNTFKTR